MNANYLSHIGAVKIDVTWFQEDIMVPKQSKNRELYINGYIERNLKWGGLE